MAVLVLAVVFVAGPLPAADPFYVDLLHEGRLAYERGDRQTAVEDLRIACFGFLEEPEMLAEALVWLAMAQAGLDDESGFRESFRRILEVEQRFGAYTGASLPDQLRQTFEAYLVRWVPHETLQVSPTFRRLVMQEEEPEGIDSPSKTAPDTSEVSSLEPQSEDRSEEPADSGSIQALSAAEESALEQARGILRNATTTSELAGAWRLAREVADAHPELSDVQHLVATIAYRSSRWAEAAEYFRRGGDPGDEQPALQFYMAVALYESDYHEEAARILRRALPRLQRTAYVDAYIERILSQASR